MPEDSSSVGASDSPSTSVPTEPPNSQVNLPATTSASFRRQGLSLPREVLPGPCLGYFLAAIRRSSSCLMIISANSGTTSHTTCSMISRESLAIASYSRPRAAMAATF